MTESIEVDVLSFIPGESENSTRGGDPFASALSQFFPEGYSEEIPISPTAIPLDVVNAEPNLIVEGSALFDNWLTGDMVESDDYPDDLFEAVQIDEDKYEEDGGISAHIYRARNGVTIEFDTNNGRIDESSVSVEFRGESSKSVTEQEDVNNLYDLLDLNGSHSVEGGYRPRYYSVDMTTVNGMEAVQVATLFGAYTKAGAAAVNYISEQDIYDFLTEVLDWEFSVDLLATEVSPDLVLSAASHLIDPLTSAFAAVPNIYAFLEVTVTAEGERYVRLWDHSPFPEHAVYVEGTREYLAGFPDEEGDGRYLNPNFLMFFAQAGAGVSPYYTSENQYLENVRDGFPDRVVDYALDIVNPLPTATITSVEALHDIIGTGPDQLPQWTYGLDPDNDELSHSEVLNALDSDPVDPFAKEISHVRWGNAIQLNPFDSGGGTDLEPIDGQTPTDPDGDGIYEDINGNGEKDFDDVVTYFNNMDDPAMTDHADAYDFNDNGQVDYADLVSLFNDL